MKRRGFLKLLGAGAAGIVAAPAFAKAVAGAAVQAPYALWLDDAACWCCRVYYRPDLNCWVAHYYAPKGTTVFEFATRFYEKPTDAQLSVANAAAEHSFRRAGIRVNIGRDT